MKKNCIRILCMMSAFAVSTMNATHFKSMVEIDKHSSLVVPFLVDKNSGYNLLNVAVNDTNTTFSAVKIPLPNTRDRNGFWIKIKHLHIKHGKSGYKALHCKYSLYDVFGNQMTEHAVDGNVGLKGEPTKMHFALGNNAGFVETNWVPFSTQDITLFIGHVPAMWNPIVDLGILPHPDSDITRYVHTHIGKSLISAGIPLDKDQLAHDIQIMLVSTQASKPTSFSSTIVCNLDHSAQHIADAGSLSDGVYIVFSEPLTSIVSSSSDSDLKYLVYNKTGDLVYTGSVNTFGSVSLPKGATIDGMLIFGSGFKDGFYSLKVSSSKIPQLFLLQYPAITAPTKDKKSNGQTESMIQQLRAHNENIQKKIAKLMVRYKKDHGTYVPSYLSNLVIEQQHLINSQAQLITLLGQQSA
ncbi:MAG TPA: hypothetical protein VLG50_04400 [Candidatus Saccharimonadales bacterium]|nr:hypothetical protein [Candidatus Saccharimonadales bacterium]